MGVFVTYRSNPFSGLANTPTTIISAYTNTLWVTALTICNRGAAPIRFNMQKITSTGLELENDCYAASTTAFNTVYDNHYSGVGATLTNNDILAAFTVDGLSPALNDRILIKDQTDTFQNGIYKVSVIGDDSTAWVLTRTLDYDTVKEINNGDVVTVTDGTVNSNTRWRQISTVTAIGTSPITFITETSSSIFKFNELLIEPYSTQNIIEHTGVINLEFGTKPFVTSKLVCFSNGYTQVYDCDVNYAQLNELPIT